MPLKDTGVRIQNPITMGENARTLNQDNEPVNVETTGEAIQDYGWGTIIAVASEKYDNGVLASTDSPPKVRVTTNDCANAQRT